MNTGVQNLLSAQRTLSTNTEGLGLMGAERELRQAVQQRRLGARAAHHRHRCFCDERVSLLPRASTARIDFRVQISTNFNNGCHFSPLESGANNVSRSAIHISNTAGWARRCANMRWRAGRGVVWTAAEWDRQMPSCRAAARKILCPVMLARHICSNVDVAMWRCWRADRSAPTRRNASLAR